MKYLTILSLFAAANAADTVTDTVALLCDGKDNALDITVSTTNLHDTSIPAG